MYDCIIVGAGLIGMLTARELSLAGLKVLLLDRQAVGQESSWAGGGILSPLYPWRYPPAVSELASWSQMRYPEFLQEIASSTGINPEFDKSGLLVVDSNEQAQAHAWATQYQVSLQSLSSQELSECEPVLSVRQDNALWLPNVAQVRNPRLVKSLKSELIRLDISIREGVEVDEFLVDSNKITGVKSSAENWYAPNVVIAGGAWSGEMCTALSIHLDVAPVQGQMMIFKTKPGFLKRIILGKQHYLIPRKDGRVLIGSTLENVGFNKHTTKQAYDCLLEAAYALVADLVKFPVEVQWAGLRPGTQNNGVPYIGEVDSIKGLFVNAGHFRNGVVLGLGSARLLAQIMLNQEPIINPCAYAISVS